MRLVPSSRSGQVDDTEKPVEAQAEVFRDEAGLERLRSLLVEKYGLIARTMFLAQKVTGKEPKRIGIRIRRA